MEGEVGRERARREGGERLREEEVEKEDEQEEIADGEAQRTHEEEEERRELQAHEGSEEDELVEVEQSPQHLEGDLAEVRGNLQAALSEEEGNQKEEGCVLSYKAHYLYQIEEEGRGVELGRKLNRVEEVEGTEEVARGSNSNVEGGERTSDNLKLERLTRVESKEAAI